LPDESAELDLSSWKVAYNGSEPVRQATLQRFTRRFGSAGFTEEAFYPCYGLAEATLLVAGFKKEDRPVALLIRKERHPDGMITLADETDADAQAVISSGTVFSGMEVRIISPEDRHECMELREGEICISGDSVTGGYWNRDNRDIFYEYEGKRFLRTGDLGFFYKGALFVQGRLTEMLIVRGRNIYPYDIEQSVSASHGAIEMNGVAAFCINPSGEELVIAAEIKRAFINGLDAEAVIRTIDRIVSGSYGVKLHDIILLSPLGIPRTTSGKLQRIKCREYYREGSFKEIASLSALSEKINNDANLSLLPVEVRGEINHATISNYLTGIIGAKIGKLHIDELNDKTELTEIGIDSLKATELINIINRDLSINIDAAKVFRDNSISGLINTIENLLWLKNEQTFGEEITI
jgi:acyl-CoA synthetase (AMP-forming)/AMP-acid ligase II/acyl carrier protein